MTTEIGKREKKKNKIKTFSCLYEMHKKQTMKRQKIKSIEVNN